MQTYYKVISIQSLFKSRYSIEDIGNIPIGTKFIADKSPYEFSKNNPSKIHFSDCAFDAMLWFQLFNDDKALYYYALAGNWQETCIYKVKPLVPYKKERTSDSLRFFECKADTIEFSEKISIEQLAKLAIDEYAHNKIKKYLTYGRKFVKARIELWQNRYIKQ